MAFGYISLMVKWFAKLILVFHVSGRMKNHRISPDGKYLAFMTHARPKAHFHWVNIANPEIENSEEGDWRRDNFLSRGRLSIRV